MTPIFYTALCRDRVTRLFYIKTLKDLKADINEQVDGRTAPFYFLYSYSRFEAISDLIDHGFDPFAFYGKLNLMHILVQEEIAVNSTTRPSFKNLVALIEKQGDSFEDAKVDLERWSKVKDLQDAKELQRVKDRIVKSRQKLNLSNPFLKE